MKFYNGEKLRHFGLIPDVSAKEGEDRTSLFFQDEELTFNDVSERTSKLASSLENEGINPGDRVGLYIPNSIQFPESLFGVVKAGAIPVPLNLRMPPRILSYVVEDSEIDTIIASPLETSVSNPETIKNIAEDTGINRLIIPGEESEKIDDYSKLIEEGDPDYEYPPIDYDDFTVHYYTSGTTGKPKGVPLTHENVLTCIEGCARASGLEPDQRLIHVLPLYHVYGLTAVLSTYLYRGSSIVFQAEPDPELILENIGKYEVSHFAGVPALFRMLWLVYEQDPEKYDLSTLDEVVCAASPLDETTRSKIKTEWQVRFAEGWGMTETSPAGTLNRGGMRKGAGCIGWPIPNIEMKIVDPKTHETLVPWEVISPWSTPEDKHINKEGELAVRGPPIFKGYHNMPEKNEEVFDDEGWFYTGDLMRMDEDKAFWMVERTDDMILSGGENIYPSEIEEALMEHEKISDAGVVAVPHKTKGKVPVAFVVQAPEADLTEDGIKEFALERVPTYAHPRRVFFKNSLPKSGALKTQHFKLESEAEDLIEEPLG